MAGGGSHREWRITNANASNHIGRQKHGGHDRGIAHQSTTPPAKDWPAAQTCGEGSGVKCYDHPEQGGHSSTTPASPLSLPANPTPPNHFHRFNHFHRGPEDSTYFTPR